MFHFTNVWTFIFFTMSQTFEKWKGLLIFYVRKKKMMTWIRTHMRSKTTFISCNFVNMTQKSVVFSGGKTILPMNWKPEEGEMLECLHEENNPYNVFSIKVCKSNNAQSVVAHLPKEISRITKFILQRGATVTGKHYWRSPLIQGGLEVPCLVTVTMPGSIMNHLLIARY